ncbi:Thiamine biosynthetic bifunctional enzyme [Colletotrichum higginsianum IMI 349063]|uniref:Thiamine biosynthetic bifunctional enzyme n=1 Tax=Colletotrichum higginsianum (strain IMI 349063) TaxID=759273 RepID=A0A1B7YPR2_COLHI|nr:Thiamine biosynthetic bifunctional enzyme [Colletotrichum higginsianum IMI 349063]OBR14027.1 Thiamine biosynthetic bifunctional enzyme [Colletotrichum higginsianum IMI 349063]
MKIDRNPTAAGDEACCTCAKLLATVPRHSTATEKPLPDDRRLECCSRVICGNCIHNNPRFASYCPYCQTSSAPSVLPPSLRDPPSYTSYPPTHHLSSGAPAAAPPPYTPNTAADVPPDEKSGGSSASSSSAAGTPPEDTLHFLDHEHDTVASLSLRYGVPAAVLRRANNITSDHLLHGRRTVLVPGEYYTAGVSLSPRPVEGEEEELRKSRIRRFMTGCKVSDYDVAVLYLEQVGYDVAAALEAYSDDEAWERDHPVQEGGRRAKAPPQNRGPFWRGSA